jgi:flagellar basal body-associated protein FliL
MELEEIYEKFISIDLFEKKNSIKNRITKTLNRKKNQKVLNKSWLISKIKKEINHQH